MQEYTCVPEELKKLPQWVARREKIPYTPHTGTPAKAGVLETWGTFEDAVKAQLIRGYDGIGFEFAEGGGIVGIDLDHCIDPQKGIIADWANKIIDRMDSYTEVSPSGSGVHIFVRGDIPVNGRKKVIDKATGAAVEMYKAKRYFTVTGAAIKSAPISDRTEELKALYAELFPERQKQQTAPQNTPEYLQIGLERDKTLQALWNGERRTEDESGNDLALFNKLAYWCNRDEQQMINAFLSSPHASQKDGAHTKKIGREDYLHRTAQAAIGSCNRTAAETEPCAKSENTLPGNVAEKKKAENGIKIVPARTLLKANLPPVKYHVVGMLPQGTAILSAPSKTGKSWLVLDMGLTIATGGVFMGHMTNQCGVLYLALEDSWNRLQDRMAKILKGKEAPENFYFATKAPTLDNGLLKFFDGHLKQHPGTDIFVIDTLQKIRGRAMAHESAYAQDYREMGAIKEFMDSHGKTVLFVHHNRKMKDEDDPFNMISGTNAIMGAADTAMVMTKAKRSDKQVTLSITGRDVLESSTVVSFNLDTYKWEAVGSVEDVNEQRDLQEYQNSNIVKTIKTLLKQSPDGRWSGKAKDLMSAGVYITQTHLAPTPQKMGHELKALDGPLRKYDGIIHAFSKNGSGGGKHYFYSK